MWRGDSAVRKQDLDMLSKLPPRERQIVDILYERGPVLVSEICEALPDQLSGSAVRAMLKRLEDKGFVERTESERGFLYSPVVSDTVAKKSALSEIVRVFFNGSPASAASALLGMSEKLKEEDLSELERMIARARQAKGGK
jgi:predicted transcriptional regulator